MTDRRVECFKCKGEGYLPEYDWSHHGKCFPCNGKGWLKEEPPTIDVEKAFRCSTFGTNPLCPTLNDLFRKELTPSLTNYESVIRTLSRVSITTIVRRHEGGEHPKLFFVECPECNEGHFSAGVECRRCSGHGLLWIPRPSKVRYFLTKILNGILKEESARLAEISQGILVENYGYGSEESLKALSECLRGITRFQEEVNSLGEGFLRKAVTMTKPAWHVAVAAEIVDLGAKTTEYYDTLVARIMSH